MSSLPEDHVCLIKPLAIVVSGSPGSGKSTLANNLAHHLGWLSVSFGQYVRSIAERRQITPTRGNLQELGESLASQGWSRFSIEVLNYFGWSRGLGVVIEGVRHIEVFEALQEIIKPMPIKWLFLEVSASELESRLASRGTGEASSEQMQHHSTEQQVASFKDTASLIIDGNSSEWEVLEVALAWLQQPK